MAALVAVVLIGAVKGHWIDGHATAGWPPPPPAGSCVGIPGGEPTTVVACDQPHLQEVVEAIAATDPRNSDFVSHWDNFCGEPVGRYIRVAPGIVEGSGGDNEAADWMIPPPQYAVGLLRAPEYDRIGEIGWLACTVRPQGSVAYTGSVRAIGRSPDRPAAFATCGSGQRGTVGYSGISCVEPHDWQVIGQGSQVPTWGESEDGHLTYLGDESDASQMRGSCLRFVADTLGVADPTYDGALVVDVAVSFQGSFVPIEDVPELLAERVQNPSIPTDPNSSESDSPTAVFMGQYECQISPADPATQLTNGMENWGDNPLPITRRP